MSYTVPAAFALFYEKINVSGDHREIANTRRDRLVTLLSNHFEVLEAFPTGSLPRFTAVKGFADVDVIVVLHYSKHIRDKSPRDVLQAVRDSLGKYRTNVRKNGQAVTLHYETWPNVDVVPASRLRDNEGQVTGYSIPDMNTGQWITSRPQVHTASVRDRASTCGSHFRKVITMIKWWNRMHSTVFQSYHLEAIAVRTFTSAMTDLTWDVFKFFDSAADLTLRSLYYEGAFVDAYLDSQARLDAIARLERARDIARGAWHYTFDVTPNHKAAMERWRVLFGDEFPVYG